MEVQRHSYDELASDEAIALIHFDENKKGKSLSILQV